MLSMLLKVTCFVKLPDVDFILYLDDQFLNEVPVLPIFHFQKKRNGPGILLPYLSHLNDLEAFHTDSKEFVWSAKISQAIWRGASTGGSYDLSNWHTFARSKLVLSCSSKLLQNMCNASYYKIVQATDEARDAMLANMTLADPIPLKEQMKFKYILSLDGNGACAGRFEQLVSGNSLIMKTESDSIEFYYTGLQPHVHFVPVKEDISDLQEKLQWVLANDDKAQVIVNNMEKYASSLSTSHISCYVQSLFNIYSKLTTFHMESLESLKFHVHNVLPGHSYNNSNVPNICKNPIYACENVTSGESEIQLQNATNHIELCFSFQSGR